MEVGEGGGNLLHGGEDQLDGDGELPPLVLFNEVFEGLVVAVHDDVDEVIVPDHLVVLDDPGVGEAGDGGQLELEGVHADLAQATELDLLHGEVWVAPEGVDYPCSSFA